MPVRVALNHKTVYRYDRPVTLSPQVVRLRPAPHSRTPVPAYALKVEPAGHFLNWQQDAYGNYLARLVFAKPVREFSVEVDLIADMTTVNPFDFFVEPAAETFPFAYDAALAKELAPYLEVQPAGARLANLVAAHRAGKRATNDFLVAVNQDVWKRVRYTVRLEPGVQTPEETLTLASGSCRDSAWLMVQLLRHLGLAARFASGYLIQLTADEKPVEGPAGPEKDFTDLHAWAEVYLPGAGWVGLDATSGLLCGEGHIPLACAAEPTAAAPITGNFAFTPDPNLSDEVGVTFEFHMSVSRVHEDPRVTKPYTPGQWEEIDRLGDAVDDALKSGDVRLTMGGEPTFVAIDDRDAHEWNTAALGDAKRSRAGELLRRLHDRFAPGGLLHFGQGKWYPGEPLPRWALGCYWRADGEAVWRNPSLVAADAHDYGVTPETARVFATALAETLGVDPAHAVPAYEDAAYYEWREQTLPRNVEPAASKLDDALERDRLAKLFGQGLKQAVGYVLPLRRNSDAGGRGWESGEWVLRREHLFLLPGDSPVGFRLPLDSLPWEKSEDRQKVHEPDPSVPRPALPPRPDYSRETAPVAAQWATSTAIPSPKGPVVRTALCVEPRAGRLMVFLPPQDDLAGFLDLVAAVEATAEHLNIPVQIEGYEPPKDDRLTNFKVTPDPGVIEVNVHPAADWGTLKAITNTLYAEAKLARLAAEKFLTDGRHAGTGGGNHIVVGGKTVLDSPFLRRPDLLRSLLGYWHNHPSLSYLFSGLFIGPTSQAPRVDEARNDAVYELELAFKQVEPGRSCPPWQVDRVFRHLLTDLTGNTHRAEFCIDKLYSPDSSTGRLGLLELRAFEMPPHPQMSLAQQLLLRTLIATFWETPYDQKLARWGTELHDRFALPHFVEADFRDVADDCRRAGFPVKAEWFAPHHEFRFPVIGTLAARGVNVEIRHALEPWHTLGEEATGGGTARYVDSSVERVQVKVRGLTDARHAVTVNGRRVPLHPTGTNGEFVAGVRFRAWQPPSCLHPTIPVNTPLVFDVVDAWQNQSIAGCRYEVAHPGGRAYDSAPVNAFEAESRRVNRFFALGHTPGKVVVPPVEPAPERPLTLDMRQPAPAVPAVPGLRNTGRNGVWQAAGASLTTPPGGQ